MSLQSASVETRQISAAAPSSERLTLILRMPPSPWPIVLQNMRSSELFSEEALNECETAMVESGIARGLCLLLYHAIRPVLKAAPNDEQLNAFIDAIHYHIEKNLPKSLDLDRYVKETTADIKRLVAMEKRLQKSAKKAHAQINQIQGNAQEISERIEAGKKAFIKEDQAFVKSLQQESDENEQKFQVLDGELSQLNQNLRNIALEAQETSSQMAKQDKEVLQLKTYSISILKKVENI